MNSTVSRNFRTIERLGLWSLENFTSKYEDEETTHAVDAATVRLVLTRAERKTTASLRASCPKERNECHIRMPSGLVKIDLVLDDMVWRLNRSLFDPRGGSLSLLEQFAKKKLTTSSRHTFIEEVRC